MTAVKENLMTMIPDMSQVIPNLPEKEAKVVYNIYLTYQTKKPQVDRKARAQKRRQLLESERYVRSSGRTHEEIEADLKEMRSDRF